MCEEPTIAIVDDEMEVQRSLCFLLKTVGYRTDIYSSAEEFQGNYDTQRPGCAILDLRMPGRNGPA